MKQYLLVIFLACFLGCAVLSRNSHDSRMDVDPAANVVVSNAAGSSVVVPVRHGLPVKKTAHPGIVFGKTDFRGILKAAYVRLTIVNRENPAKIYYFYVGRKDNQNLLPWGKGEVIEPGYFFLQLPAGKYEVTAIAIPVSSTVAEEAVALDMEVSMDKVFYLGTLELDGIKERAKFGGVPLVKPGFEYTLIVNDDFEAAWKDFEHLLPRHDVPLAKKLFVVK